MPDFANGKTVFSKKNITFAYIFFNLLYVPKPKNQKTKKPKNLRKFLYIFLILFAVFQACKPKYQEEIKPESLPKHNKTGVSTAKKWWQNQKTSAQNLQQKGGEPNFEDVFVPDWTNAESRTSQKGKLQIRVPLLQNDSLHTPIFIPFTDEKGVKHFGTIELLLQANPDSTFQKLYNTIGTTDSTNRFDVQKNNFFRKEDNFYGKEMFFDAQIKKSNLVNEFSKGTASESHIKVEVNLAGLCVTIRYYKDRNGNEVIVDITMRWCIGEGGGGGSNAGGSFTRVEYLSNSNGQWSNPILTGVGGGVDVDVIVPPDPFDPPSEEYQLDNTSVSGVKVDISITNHQKLYGIWQKMMTKDSYVDLLKKFKDTDLFYPQTDPTQFSTLIVRAADLGYNPKNFRGGVTSKRVKDGKWCIIITINNNTQALNRPKWDIAKDFFHETEHALDNSETYRSPASVASGFAAEKDDLLDNLPANIPSELRQTYQDWKALNKPITTSESIFSFISHRKMAKKANRNRMKAFLKQYIGNPLPYDITEDMLDMVVCRGLENHVKPLERTIYKSYKQMKDILPDN